MSFKKLDIVAKFGDQLNREENKSRWPKKGICFQVPSILGNFADQLTNMILYEWSILAWVVVYILWITQT